MTRSAGLGAALGSIIASYRDGRTKKCAVALGEVVEIVRDLEEQLQAAYNALCKHGAMPPESTVAEGVELLAARTARSETVPLEEILHALYKFPHDQRLALPPAGQAWNDALKAVSNAATGKNISARSATEQKNAAPQVSDIAMPDVLEIAEVLLMWRQGASQYLYQSEDAWKTARVVRTDRLLNTLKAAPLSDTAEFSLGGCAPRLYGASGTTGALGPFGLTVHDDHALPDDVLEFRDHITGRVLAKIINVGKS